MLSLWPGLQLEGDRLGYPFSFSLSLFMDEINLYTPLIYYIGLPFYMRSMLHVRIDPID